MSIAESHTNHTTSTAVTRNNGKTHSTNQPAMPISVGDKEELDKLDAAFQRIATAIPEYPYSLSVLVNVEPRFHYRSAQEAASWARGTPFSFQEEGLQYMTYVYREPGESCFSVKSHIDEERERLAVQAATQSKRENFTGKVNGSALGAGVAGKRPDTPVGAKGKKISLEAYKSKLAAGGATGPKEQSPEKEAVRPMNMESKEADKTDGVHEKQRIEGKRAEKTTSSSLKRPHESEDKNASNRTSKSAKRPRLSPPPSVKSSPFDHSNEAPHGLPALLSPTNPFIDSTSKSATPRKRPVSKTPWDLPAMLSPTLHPRIEAELKKEKEREQRGESGDKATPTPGSSAPSSAQKQPSKDKKNGVSAATLQKSAIEERPVRRLDDHGTTEETPSQPVRKRLIVKMRFNKKNCRVLSKMLRYPPQHDRAYSIVDKAKDMIMREDDREADYTEKDRKKKKAAEELMKNHKRPRLDDAEPHSGIKKSKFPAPLDLEKNPKTPISSAAPSPSIQKSGGSGMSITNTPGAGHLKAIAMVRTISGDTPASTPGGKASHLTPLAAITSQKPGKGPTSVPINGAGTSVRSVEANALNSLSQHYNQLGRKLKHENSALNALKSKDQQSEPERKRAALLGLECIISYMLAFALGDARRRVIGRPSDIESTWKTLLPLFKQLRVDMTRYHPLISLHSSLGVAINARIVAVASERLSRSLPTSSAGAPVAADSPSSTVETNGDGGMAKVLVDAARSMIDCSREAAIHFPVEEIQRVFKRTWEQRAIPSSRDAAHEALVNDKGESALSGRYCIPVGVEASPLYAVRYGVSLIKEFIAVEELGYEPRIRI